MRVPWPDLSGELDGETVALSIAKISISLPFDRITLKSILTSFIEPLGRQFMDSASFGEAPDRRSHEQRQAAIVAHLGKHDSFQLFGHKDDLYPRTAREYNFVKSFGLGTAVAAIAAFESVPSSTITRRLSRARDAGLVAKQLKTLRKPKKDGKEKSN